MERFPLTVAQKPPCRLGRGELRRVSINPILPLVGYYLACPKCGFVNVAFHEQQGQFITEQNSSVSFEKPIQCVFCDARFIVKNSIAEFDGGEVRRVRWK